MIWTLDKLKDCNNNQAEINGKWVTARPVNYRYRSFRKRISEAWSVFSGKAEAFIWPEEQ